MKHPENSPLFNPPVLDEQGMLSDAGQLRDITYYLVKLLDDLVADPIQLLQGRNEISIITLALHAFTCPDCAAIRAEEGILVTDEHREALNHILKAFVETDIETNAQEAERAVEQVLDEDARVRRAIDAAMSRVFGPNGGGLQA